MGKQKFEELFVRHEGNPILTADMWLYPVDRVFNPAAVKHNKETILLARVVDRRGFSHLSRARSKDGRTGWKIDPKPTLEPDPSYCEFKKGFEDPRIVWVDELQEYIVSCISFRAERTNTPYGISLLGTKDFSIFRRISKPLDSENKNASLFPRRIKGLFALIHRPVLKDESYIAVSFSEDLISWNRERLLFSTREWYWDSVKIGLACPPIETEKGWLIIYHGSEGKAHKLIYRVGLALLNLEDLYLTHRSEEWVLGPQEAYEGLEDGIVFPCGYTLNSKTKELRIYYGTNDSSIGLAIGNLEEIVDYLMKCPAQ